jgi:hypothetical protein
MVWFNSLFLHLNFSWIWFWCSRFVGLYEVVRLSTAPDMDESSSGWAPVCHCQQKGVLSCFFNEWMILVFR